MSLFIGGLAFDDQLNQNLVRVGVITGSLLAGLAGAFVIWRSDKGAVDAADAPDAVKKPGVVPAEGPAKV